MSTTSDGPALGFLGAPSIPEMVRLARLAEERGFASIWVAETRLRRDAISAAAAIAAGTRRVRVATGLINVYTRNPVLIAVTAASLAELAEGRFTLGMGAGSEEVLAVQGEAYDRPFTRLKEYLDVLVPLLAGEVVTYRGQTIQVHGAQLEVVPRLRVPIYLGVTGPRGLALAAAAADGVLLDVFMPVAYVRRAAAAVAEAARAVGRDPSVVEVAGIVMTFVGRTGPAARDAVRPAIAGYLTKFPTIAAQSGFPPEIVAALRRDTLAAGPEAGARHVTDDMVDALCVAGTGDDCRAGVERFRAAGLACPVLMTSGDVAALIDTFRVR